MKKSTVLLALTLLCFSCKKDEEQAMPTWPFEFLAINNGDAEIKGIAVHTSVGYPIANETYWIGTIKAVDQSITGNSSLKRYDTVRVSAEKNVYPGCNISFVVSVSVPKKRIRPQQINPLYPDAQVIISYDLTQTIQSPNLDKPEPKRGSKINL